MLEFRILLRHLFVKSNRNVCLLKRTSMNPDTTSIGIFLVFLAVYTCVRICCANVMSVVNWLRLTDEAERMTVSEVGPKIRRPKHLETPGI